MVPKQRYDPGLIAAAATVYEPSLIAAAAAVAVYIAVICAARRRYATGFVDGVARKSTTRLRVVA